MVSFGPRPTRFSCRHFLEEEKPKLREGPLSEIDSHLHSMNVWKTAEPPNYDRNVNKFYPYSELPYVGEYTLLKIPISLQNLLDHVDYWGEGRSVTQLGTTGFTDCYNINEKYRLVSKGSDVDRKIPNRIPVFSTIDCDTSNYIKKNSVRLVTISGGPISRSCAHDIARIVNKDVGMVVTFGYDKDSEDIKNLEESLKSENLIYCSSPKLPTVLSELTAFDTYRAYLCINDLQEELQRNIADDKYEDALTISRDMEKNKYGSSILNIVTKMLKEGYRNVVYYAYKLWHSNEKEIVKNYFPAQFAIILNEENVKIINKKYNLPIKLGEVLSSDKTTKAEGGIDGNVNWKFTTVWEDNNLSFYIENVDNKLYLNLSENKINGNRQLYGKTFSNDLKFKWSLEPVMNKNHLLFKIINKKFYHGLKMIEDNGEKLIVTDEMPIHELDVYGWDIVQSKKA